MIGFEERLRRRLHEVAEAEVGHVPPGFDDHLGRAARRRHRRAAAARAGAGALAVVVAISGAVVLRDRGDEQVVTASPPPGTDAPDGWAPLPPGPLAPRFQHLSLAMGDKVLVWGGYAGDGSLTDGAVYDAATGTWRRVPPSPLAPTDRGDAMGAWTGREAVVLAGVDGARAAAYDPERDEWRRLPDPPLPQAANAMNAAVWTGREVVVIGVDQPDNGAFVAHVAAYDPETGQWRRGADPGFELSTFADAVWTGREVLFVGSEGGAGGAKIPPNAAVGYDPAADTWRRIPWSLPGVRGDMVVAWTGRELFVGGGHAFDAAAPDAVPRTDAALYDPEAGTWRPAAPAPVPFVGNDRYAEVWTGRWVVTLNDGAGPPVLYDPATDTWHVGPPSALGDRRAETPWVWAGGRVLALAGGLTNTEGEGASSCCTPIEGGEGYRPPA